MAAPSRQVGRRVAASPVVSVIVPAYNTAPFIAETLDSVLAQTFTEYEIVVVNDGSPDTDELEHALTPYFDHIVYIKQENRGLSGARNTAIRAARGRLLALLDSDDAWQPDYLAVQVGEMERDPSVDVLYPNALVFGDGPHAGKEYMEMCPSAGEVTFESLVSRRCNVFISATMRREVVVRAGIFDESLRSVEDFDLWLRIVKQGGRIAYHRRVLARYRKHAGSLSANPASMYEQALVVFDKAERTMELNDAERVALQEATARFRALLRLTEGKQALSRNDVKAAVNALSDANFFFHSRKIALALLLMRLSPKLLQNLYNLRDRLVSESPREFRESTSGSKP